MPESSRFVLMQVDQQYIDKRVWTKKSILNALRAGKFSSDRSIREYSQKIWGVEPCKVLEQVKNGKETTT